MIITRSMETDQMKAEMLDHGGSLYRRKENKQDGTVEWQEVIDPRGFKDDVTGERADALEEAYQDGDHEEA